MKNIAFKPLLLPKEDYAACVHVDKGNQTILKVYKRTMKTTMTAALDLFFMFNPKFLTFVQYLAKNNESYLPVYPKVILCSRVIREAGQASHGVQFFPMFVQ